MNLLDIKKLLRDYEDQFRKAIVTRINDLTSLTVNNKKTYKAILTQSGTAAPVPTVLENTIGNIVWTRQAEGSYLGTLTGAFPVGKTIIKGPQNPQIPDATALKTYITGSDDANTVYVVTKNIDITNNLVTPGDDLLYGAGYTSIEIEVYN